MCACVGGGEGEKKGREVACSPGLSGSFAPALLFVEGRWGLRCSITQFFTHPWKYGHIRGAVNCHLVTNANTSTLDVSKVHTQKKEPHVFFFHLSGFGNTCSDTWYDFITQSSYLLSLKIWSYDDIICTLKWILHMLMVKRITWHTVCNHVFGYTGLSLPPPLTQFVVLSTTVISWSCQWMLQPSFSETLPCHLLCVINRQLEVCGTLLGSFFSFCLSPLVFALSL